MIACALTGPMPGSASSSSFVAVLMLTAAIANVEKNSITSKTSIRRIDFLQWKNTSRIACHTHASGLLGAMLRAGTAESKQCADISRHAFLDAKHGCGVTGAAQTPDIGLCKALVLADQRWGKADVLDRAASMQFLEWQRRVSFGSAARVDRGRGHGIECRRLARANVEDSRSIRVIEKVQVHLDDIVDAHEVAALLARGVSSGPLEQAHLAGRSVLIEKMPDHRCHALLVRLARAVDVEIPKTRDLCSAFRKDPAHVLVEQEFRVPVDVERQLTGAFLPEGFAGAVHRSR